MKKTLILSIILAIVVGAIAIFLILKPSAKVVIDDEVEKLNELESDSNVTTDIVHGKGSLTSLLSLGKNMECTIDYSASSSESTISGSYFVSDGKMRGDFVIPNPDGDIVSSMIMANDILYSWSKIAGQSYGMKMSLDENNEIKKKADAPDSHEAVPLNAEVSYNCKPWLIVDASIFEPPTDVIFKEYDQAVQSGMEYGTIYEGTPTAESPCALCEQVPAGESRDQCKTNFKCTP